MGCTEELLIFIWPEVLAVQTEHNKDCAKKGFMTVSMEKVCMAKSWPVKSQSECPDLPQDYLAL